MAGPRIPCAWHRLASGTRLLQTKLTVNVPGDRYEQEADRVADEVLQMPDPAAGGAPPAIQRMCPECAEEQVQRQLPEDEGEQTPLQAKGERGGSTPTVPPRTEARISGLRGGGRPLPRSVRGYFEPRFGRDLSGIRVHTGSEAAAAAREVRARAFTVGSDVAFAPGEYRPDSAEGRRLLAHELVHTVQQGSDRVVRRRYLLNELQATVSSAGAGNLIRATPPTMFFPGSPANTSDRKAFVVAGIHGDEPSAIALGGAVENELTSRTLVPDFHTLFVPRANPTPGRGTASVADLNREFGGSTPSAEPIASEIQTMVSEFRPERILSIHAVSNPLLGGLYLDPIRASGSAPSPTGTAPQREAAFTHDPRNRAAMTLTEQLIGEVRGPGAAGARATRGNDPGRKAIRSGGRTQTLTFPRSRYPGTGAGSSAFSLLYPQQGQVRPGRQGETSLGEWASQLPWAPGVVTLEVPEKPERRGGSNWRPFLPAVRRFLRLGGGRSGTPGVATTTPGGGAHAVDRSLPTGSIQRVPLSESDLHRRRGIPFSFIQEVYRRQVAIWTARRIPYTHAVAETDLVMLPASDRILGRSIRVHRAILGAVRSLLAAARRDLAATGGSGRTAGVRELSVRSGYRSATDQFSIWEREFPRYYGDTRAVRAALRGGEHGAAAAQHLAEYVNERVFSPGYSPHQRAQTIDVSYRSAREWPGAPGNWAPADTSRAGIATWEASWFFRWLRGNAARFGFVQNPRIREPWHWEVDRSAAELLLLGRAILRLLVRIWRSLLRVLGVEGRPEEEGVEPAPEAPGTEPGSEPGRPQDEPLQRQPSHEAETGPLQARGAGAGGAPAVSRRTEARISGLHDGCRPLPDPARDYFEPRLGRDLGGVRVHTGGAAAAAREVRARAFTVGSDVAFAPGEWRPEIEEGRRLLAHELVHTVQQRATGLEAAGAPRVERRLPPGTVAGDWIIDNPARRVTSGGKTDGEHVADAFGEICGLAFRSGSRIQVGLGPPSPNQTHGCACLNDIEADLASSTPTLTDTPHVQLGLHGWSFTSPSAPLVSARHPDTELGWGYWTGGQTRHLKPFWQTVAHEVCGHMATFVRTGGTHAGGRGSATGHNPAIEEENRIAGEHGVPVAEQRGLDVDPGTGRPLPGHRGESFLAESVMGFAHGSAAPPAAAAGVVSEAAETVQTVATSLGLDLLVQVDGKAFGNEGGLRLARRRAQAVRAAIRAELTRRSIPTTITVSATRRSRFTPDLASVVPGASVPQASDPDRRVEVFLFHKLHSAGP